MFINVKDNKKEILGSRSMKPDLIFANAPFGKPGVDITKYIMENFPDANYAMLNTRTAFKKYYDKLACQYATIGKYLFGTNENLHWVEQAILLATNGWTEVVDNRKQDGGNKVGMNSIFTSKTSYYECHTAHLVQVNKSGPALGGAMDRKTCSLVGVSIQTTSTANVINRDSFLTETDKDIPPIICNGKRDYNLRSGYLYISFETFEEACECAIDIISWKNPTDSHYRCVRWGFVCGLIPHKK